MRKRLANRMVRQAHRAPQSQQRVRGCDRRTRDGEDEPTVTTTIVAREPDATYPQGLAALGDALVLQMFDSGLGETLRMAYTMLQKHQERQPFGVAPAPLPGLHPLAGHRVVFTGKLSSLGRKDACALVARLGGVTSDDVTSKTTMTPPAELP